jgi:hypothetical protein
MVVTLVPTSREHCMQYILSYFLMMEPLQCLHMFEFLFVMVVAIRAKPVFTAASSRRQKDVIVGLSHTLF